VDKVELPFTFYVGVGCQRRVNRFIGEAAVTHAIPQIVTWNVGQYALKTD
jgi:hypothetical protein